MCFEIILRYDSVEQENVWGLASYHMYYNLTHLPILQTRGDVILYALLKCILEFGRFSGGRTNDDVRKHTRIVNLVTFGSG